MSHCGRSQTDQGEVLDDCCHMTSTLGTFCFKGHIIIIDFFLDTNSVKCRIIKGKWKYSEKPPNPMRETGEENREITKDILAL